MIKSTSLSQIYQHNFSSYIRLNQQVSHKFINTIFPTYIQQHAMKFNNCLSKIYQHNFSGLYTIKSTSLSQIYQHNFSDLYISTILTSNCLSQIYQHNFPSYIRLNQQVTVSQKSFHNRLNNESFTHIQKKLKYLLR